MLKFVAKHDLWYGKKVVPDSSIFFTYSHYIIKEWKCFEGLKGASILIGNQMLGRVCALQTNLPSRLMWILTSETKILS